MPGAREYLGLQHSDDMETGEPFVFDGSAFYAHNAYESGNWRTPRHRLSSKTYIRTYKRHLSMDFFVQIVVLSLRVQLLVWLA